MAEEEVKKEEVNEESSVAEENAATDECPSVEAEKPVEEAAEKSELEEIDWKDKYARAMADFANFKKRTERDREDLFRYAEGKIIEDILPTVDNLSLALSKAENKDDQFVKGVQLVYDTLLSSLKNHEAEPFDSAGLPLDVEKMEAIAQMPNQDVEEGIVFNEVTRGWMMRGKVLRAAKVVVSAGKPE